MKHLFHFLAAIIFMGNSALIFGQSRGAFDGLNELGDKAVFVQCNITETTSTTTVVADNDRFEMHLVNNQFDRLHAFQLNKKGTDKHIINGGFGLNASGQPYLTPNHYTQPSLIYSSLARVGYAYVDGFLYVLKDIDDYTRPSKFNIDMVYVPTGKTSNGKPSKVGFKTKMEGFKYAERVKKKDNMAILKAYFADMEAVQEKATSKFSPEILAEIEAIANGHSAHVSSMNKANADYWNSEEGQRKLKEGRNSDQGANRVTIKNETGGRIYIMSEGGTVSWIASGGDYSTDCGDAVYYADDDGSGNHSVRGALIHAADSDCGGSITLE